MHLTLVNEVEALMSRDARNRKNKNRNNHGEKDIPKITITAKITKIINQGRDTDKYNE